MKKAIIVGSNKKNSATERLMNVPDIDVTASPSLESAEREAAGLQAAAIVVGPTVPLPEALAFAERLARSNRAVGCILIAESPTADILRQALRAGFRDVVTDDGDEVIAAVHRTFEMVTPSTTDPDRPDVQVEPRRSRVITFFSIKGGVGKTVFATNTAVGLALRQSDRVILLDLDQQSGDVGVMLGMTPEHTMADLVPSVARLDADMLGGFLSKHSSGAEVLLAPVNPGFSEIIKPEELQKLFDVAREAGGYVVVDTASVMGENTLTILDNSDEVCLITTLDVPSVKNTQIAMQTLETLNYPKERVRLILNRADSKVSLTPSEVERHLKQSIAVQVPSDRAVPRSVNEGTPLLMAPDRTAIAAALTRLVDLVQSVEPGAAMARPVLSLRSESEVG